MADRRADPTPSVVVSHLNIVYRVFGSRRSAGRSPRALLRRGTSSARSIHAVRDVSFVANHGESIGIIGRNGSGKSTLLRAVAGLIPPTSGGVWADGSPSLLGVNAVLVKSLSGAQNVYIGAQALGLSKDEVDAKFDDIVEFAGIGEAISRPMSTYSSGMAARLRFAISTAARPGVLVIDEALATGDAEFRSRSHNRILNLRDQAGTVFLVSHSAKTIREMCDRALWLDDGELIADGPADDVMDLYEGRSRVAIEAAAEIIEEAVDTVIPGVPRWHGSTIHIVSTQVSRNSIIDQVDDVVIASGRAPLIALSAVPLATRYDAPVLLTSEGGAPPKIRAEVARLGASRIRVLGGEDVVSPDAMNELGEAAPGAETIRIDGDTAGGLSVKIADSFGASHPLVYLVSPQDPPMAFAVAVHATRAGAPMIIWQAKDEADILDALVRWNPERVVVAATGENISDVTIAGLRSSVNATVERWAGSDPCEITAATAARNFPGEVERVYLASTEGIADGVTAASVAGILGEPVFLIQPSEVPPAVHAELERLAPTEIVVVGGRAKIEAQVRAALPQYLRGGEESPPEVDETALP